MSTDIKPASALKKNNTSKAKESIIVRLSRGRSLKITFKPRIRVAKLLVKLLAIATGLFTSVIGTNAYADIATNALPTGGQVVHGISTIQQAGNALNINQASQKTIINWQTFDIGAQASVNFYQPNASAIALNRVLGDNASQIFGKLNANGQVFLLNPHGTLFAPSAQVNVGGLLNSTMHMTDENFINGNYSLTNAGNGLLDNQGTINANSIVFAGNDINNSGNLIATNVSLVAGDTVAVDLSGDGLIRARVQNPAVQAHITNSGLIDAVQQVTMSAGQVKDTLNSLVNNTGIVRATGLVNEGGIISLQAGKTLNSGSLDASSATGLGGKVAMLGEHVGVTGTGSIDVSGKSGGGTILVGGDFQGKNTEVQNASRTFFGKDASLNADATETGNGGKIIVWADDVTRGYGNISARGGDISGNGGFVEVSGKRSLDYQATTDTRAPNGNIGTLLLDPDFINISSISVNAGLADVDQFADPTGNAIIDPTTLNGAGTNIILQANQDIIFSEGINIVGSGVGITAQAGGDLIVNAPITTNGGIVNLTSGDLNSLSPQIEAILFVGFTIDTTGGGVAPNGANVLLTSNKNDVDFSSIEIAANVNAGTLGNITITDFGHNLSQTGGILTGNKLTIGATDNVTLNGANQLNEVEITTSNFIPSSISDIEFNNTRDLVITGITVTAGGGNGGNITITNTGNITQNANISTHSGDITITNTGNITQNLNADISTQNGDIAITNTGNIVQNGEVSTQNGNINISTTGTNHDITIGALINTGTSGNTTTINSSGDILATATGLVNSGAGNGNITLQAAGDIGDISGSGNPVTVSPGTSTVNIIAGGNINVDNNGVLDISKYTVSAGLNNALVRLSSAGNLNINASLTSTNFFTQDDNLSFVSRTGNIIISDNIQIEEANTVEFSSFGSINIGSGTGLFDINITQEDGVSINAGNAININNNFTRNTSSDKIHLIAGVGGISGTGSITTNSLSIQSAGNVSLNGGNQVTNLAANVTTLGRTFNFNNNSSLNIATVNSINGITTNNGAASISGVNLFLDVLQPINLGNADLSLSTSSTTSGISINNTIDAHNITLQSAGSINIFSDITASGNFSALVPFLALGNITIVDSTPNPLDPLISSAGDITLSSVGNINIAAGIQHTASSTHNLNISAGNNIVIEGGSDFTSPNAAMTVTLTSNNDSTGTGRIFFNNDISDGGVDILSNGGNITLAGGTGGTGFALGNPGSGILFDHANLDARGTTTGGNITLRGRTENFDGSSSGVDLQSSIIKTSGAGTIDITGQADAEGNALRGVFISGTTIESINGNITITGDASAVLNPAGANSDGVKIDAGSLIITQGSGNINVSGISGTGGTNQAGIAIADSPTEIDTHGTGNIALIGESRGTGPDSFGTVISNNALVETEGTGSIFISGQAKNIDAPGVAIGSGSSIKTLQGGELTISAENNDTSPGGANHIELAGSSIQGSSGSEMFLFTLGTIPGIGIAVGGDGSTLGGFNLSDADLTAITGFDKVQVGSTAHTGTFNVATLNSFSGSNKELKLESNTSLIDFTAPSTSIATDLFVNAANGSIELNSLAVTGKLTALARNNITLKSSASVTATDKILLAAQTGNFINNAGINALSAPNHWTVVSQDPSLDTRGGLVYNYKQYNTTYIPPTSSFSQPIQGIGDGFVYAIAPSLTTTLTGNPDDVSKVYDATTFADLGQLTTSNFNASGLVDTDTISTFTATTLNYIDKNVGTGKTVTANSVSLAITDSTGANVYGYTNQNISAISGNIGEITPADISAVNGITANNKVYDATDSATLNSGAATFTGIIGSDVLTVATATGTFVDENAANGKTVNISGITLGGTDAGNYNLLNDTATTSANISKADITNIFGLTANDKTYDGTNLATINTSSAILTGIAGLDDLIVANALGNFSDANAGSNKLVNISGLVLGGVDAGNYNLNLSTPPTATANIAQADLTITANDLLGKIYGDTAALSGTAFTSTPLVGSETIGSLTLVSAGSSATASVGAYAITPSAATGTFNPANYNITYVNGSLTVTPKPITVTADNRNKVYGNTLVLSGTEFTSTALANSETIGSVSFLSTGSSNTANVGTYALTPSNATGGTFNPANYTITYADGNLTVTPLSLVITAGNQNKVYGDLFSFSGTEFTSTALANGETIGIVTLTSSGASATGNVGSYSIIASSPTGGTFNAANYNISYVNGTFVVTQAPLTLSAVTDSRIYDGTKNSSASVLVSGLKNADSVVGLQQEFDSKNAGLRTINVSSGYTINDGNGGANYLVMTNASSGEITPAPLFVSAQGVNKLFDGTTVAQVTLADNRIAGDNLTITNSSANFVDAEVGTNKQIDVLGIEIAGGLDAGNYELQNTDTIAFADIFKEDGTQEANLTETNVIDSTQNLALALTPIQVKILNPDGSESAINVDVPKGKVLSCK